MAYTLTESLASPVAIVNFTDIDGEKAYALPADCRRIELLGGATCVLRDAASGTAMDLHGTVPKEFEGAYLKGRTIHLYGTANQIQLLIIRGMS